MTSATLSASEFKAKCLDILDRVADGRLDQVVITKRGKPVATLSPPPTLKEQLQGLHGFMRGTVHIPEDFDLTEPVFDGVCDAADGKLHR